MIKSVSVSWLVLLCVLSFSHVVAQTPGLDVRLVTDEADAVLMILGKRAVGSTIMESDWQRLFQSEGYRRLKQREASLQRSFEDSTFKSFILSDELLDKRAALQGALAKWASVDLPNAAKRAFAYLPDEARIRVKVYPSIKPRTNTFVFEPRTDPAIFFYLDPSVSPLKFENTLIHEFHHIGHASVCPEPVSNSPQSDRNLTAALAWMGGFAEGRAVLAAAGAPDVHPHALSDSVERAIWDRDVANLERDMRRLEEFFLAVAAGSLGEEEQNRLGMSFMSADSVPQGAFYTVGYVMGRTVESQLGRERLVRSSCNPRMFITDYNAAASAINVSAGPKLPLWSNALLRRLSAG